MDALLRVSVTDRFPFEIIFIHYSGIENVTKLQQIFYIF